MTCRHCYLGLLSLQTVRYKFLLFISYSICGILSQQQKWAKTVATTSKIFYIVNKNHDPYCYLRKKAISKIRNIPKSSSFGADKHILKLLTKARGLWWTKAHSYGTKSSEEALAAGTQCLRAEDAKRLAIGGQYYMTKNCLMCQQVKDKQVSCPGVLLFAFWSGLFFPRHHCCHEGI